MGASEATGGEGTRLRKLLALLERDPADAFCLYGVALEHAKSGQHAQALEWFERSIAADPASAYAHYHLAKSLLELGRPGQALAALERGLQAAQGSGDAHAAGEISQLKAQIQDEA